MNKQIFFLIGAVLFLFVPAGIVARGSEVSDVQIADAISNDWFSTAGYYQLPGSGREVSNFNVGWRFYKGDAVGAEKRSFEDSAWTVVNTPDGLELLPEEASGSVNYQGAAWYRKHFKVDDELKGKKISMHFEAVMGKCKIWVNDKLVGEHFGGYLPIIVDISDVVEFDGSENIVSVRADNSNDGTYPPGKRQNVLDFTYCGGIYRDVWLIATNEIHITDANSSGTVAGGGVFVHCEEVSKESVKVVVEAEVVNNSGKAQSLKLYSVVEKDGKGRDVAESVSELVLADGEKKTIRQKLVVDKPNLWTPDNPYLYDLMVFVEKIPSGKSVTPMHENILDGMRLRVGLRKIEFRGKDGFYLNGEPYEGKLIGGNRHQDFAYVGNALPNSIQWRDVKKLRDAGMKVIRCAHYPQDPAFMDACDQLGMFVIVTTPGWQYFPKLGTELADMFEQRVYDDIRNMVRRDRNRPGVLMWEPILNETRYPKDFAKNAHDITHEEYPHQGCYTACDSGSAGNEYYDVIYTHPHNYAFVWKCLPDTEENQKKVGLDYGRYDKSLFCREWGDNVNDWNTQDSDSRIARGWGEQAQLIQAEHYSVPGYVFTSYETICRQPRQFVGGTLWHPFDHQRGYKGNPFYGGIMDGFRQAKYSYYMFQSQRDPKQALGFTEGGPFLYVANELTPVSSGDVVVYTNCDQVRLTVLGKEAVVKDVQRAEPGMPHRPVVFEDTYHYMDIKRIHRHKHWDKAKIIAEGLIDGKVVITEEKLTPRRGNKITLEADYQGRELVADGSDFIVVTASVTDDNGSVRRLSGYTLKFDVQGEGVLIGDVTNGANPRKVSWGTAPMLVRSTTKAGEIVITASTDLPGTGVPASARLVINSILSSLPLNYLEMPKKNSSGKMALNDSSVSDATVEDLKFQLEKTRKELEELKQKEVGRQQEDFEKTGV